MIECTCNRCIINHIAGRLANKQIRKLIKKMLYIERDISEQNNLIGNEAIAISLDSDPFRVHSLEDARQRERNKLYCRAEGLRKFTLTTAHLAKKDNQHKAVILAIELLNARISQEAQLVKDYINTIQHKDYGRKYRISRLMDLFDNRTPTKKERHFEKQLRIAFFSLKH